MKITAGQELVWEKISETECRLTVQPLPFVKPDPLAAIGFARQHNVRLAHKTSAAFMKESREDEAN